MTRTSASGRRPMPAAPASSGSREPGARLPHLPALDGLRGLAVAVVVLFHGGFSWMAGGYLGVSTFFTLSGFLITSLLLAERASTATIDLRAFWTRRFRRLMPAALAALALAAVFGIVAADAVQQRNLAGDVTASLLDVANWRFILSGQAYADLFGAPSPVLHFWSLAIEEQFYLLYPVVAWVAFRVLRGSRGHFAALLAALTVASVSLTLFAGFSPDRIYLGTDTRAAELLIGALLAVAIYDRRVTEVLAHGRHTRWAILVGGPLALAACAVLWISVPQDTEWLYRGGFPAYALLTTIVVVAAIVPFGPVRSLLAVAPLRRLGLISYGVYLYHWPVFLWLSPERTGWSDTVLLAPRLAVTFALALLSYRYLETPVRRGARLLGTRPVRFVPLVAAALVITTLVVTLDAPRPIIDLDQAAAELETLSALPDGTTGSDAAAVVGGPPSADGAVPAPPPPPPVPVLGTPPRPRVGVFGDSTALMTAMGLFIRGQTSGEIDYIRGDPQLGCGIGRGGEYRSGNEYGVVPEKCNWGDRWAERVATGQPNVAVVQIGPWDVGDRRLAGDDTWRSLGDPVYDDFLLAEMTDAVDTLSAGGAQVLWLSAPPVGAGSLGDAQKIRGVAAIPERTARLNELIRELPALRPGKVRVVDLAGWLESTGEDLRLRPDGVHFSKETAIEVSERWLEQALIDEFHAAWNASERERLAQASAARTTVLVLGDPSAAGIAESLATWGASSGLVDVVTIGQPACGLLPTSSRRGPSGVEPTPAECDQVQYGWMQSAVAAQADVILVAPSIWDLTEVSFDGGPLVAIGDADFDERAAAEIGELDRALRRAAPSVIWLAPPPLSWHGTDGVRGAAIDPSRSTRYASLLDAATVAPASTVVDLGELVARAPALTADPASPVDGFVLDRSGNAVLGLWLGPVVIGSA